MKFVLSSTIESELEQVKYHYNPQRRPHKQLCLFSNSTDVVSSGIYLSGFVYLDHSPYKKHDIDKSSKANKIEVGVMVDPAQGFKHQIVYSDPVIPVCATQPMPLIT